MIDHIIKKGILKKVSTIILSIAFFSVAFLFNSSYVFAEEEEENNGYCWFCNTKDNQAVKEKQFANKIKIIKSIFPEQINSAALAATVLYIDMDASIGKYYDKDFDESKFRENWQTISDKLNVNNEDGEGKIDKTVFNMGFDDEGKDITNKEIDLLTAAAIVMVLSNGFGPYDEEAYKKALMLDKGFTDLVFQLGPFEIEGNGFLCSIPSQAAGTYATAITKGIDALNPFKDYTMSDMLTYVTNMHNICELGFLGATYNNVKNISDPEIKKKKKEDVIETIFYLANNYKKWFGMEDESCVFTGSTGDYANWLQCDPAWKNVSLGGTSNICTWGCTATSSAIQIARSGTKIVLPSGASNFNPGTFVKSISKHGGFSGGGMTWQGWNSIAPNMNSGYVVSSNYTKSNQKQMAKDFAKILNTPEKGKYQRFIILQFSYTAHGGYSSPQHWVAVEGVKNDTVIINDPGYKGNTFAENYSSWNIYNYRILYATDVPFGSSNSGVSSSGSTSDACGGGTGTIKIPEKFGHGGYTVTFYHNRDNAWSWARQSKQGKLYYDHWIKNPTYDNGIATYEDRYLIACTKTFGDVGDKVDFFLEDGTRIPCIIADIKSSGDAGYNKWGHSNGQHILEFEVSRSYFNKYGNPGNKGWFAEWGGKRVSSATNLGSIW